MNQEQLKNILIKIEEPREYFELLFTGKKSNKVDGFYRPSERKIYIHNKNMRDDNQLIYTALHEYAHHIHVTESALPVSNRCHTVEFRNILHRLVEKAENLKYYCNSYCDNKNLKTITIEIKEKFLKGNAQLMKEFGKKLLEAQKICRETNVDFEDYTDRILGLGKSFAQSVIKTTLADIDPSIGYLNMKTVAAIPNKTDQKAAEKAFQSGRSPDQVKALYGKSFLKKEVEVEVLLKNEKKRIERTILNLNQKLIVIDRKLEVIEKNESGAF